jgi:hypothetical protein
MLDEILTLALVLMIATHAALIRRCTSLEGQIPLLTEGIHVKADCLEGSVREVRDLIDEALDLMGELPSAPPALMPQSGEAESIPQMILSTLISRMSMGPADASTTQPQEWEVLPPNDTPPNTQDDQP